MRKLVFLILIVIAYLIFRPIIGDVWYPMHDTTSVVRAYLLEKTLSSGQVPAIWSAELNNGMGYPLFHFYAPAMTYLSLLFKSVTGSYFVGIKIVLILSSIFGMAGMYFLMRKHGRLAGLVSALSYGLLPYAAVNLYVRGAYSEYLSMCLLPWLFYFWQNLKNRKSIVYTVVVTVAFILSHNLVPFITLPFLVLWVYLNNQRNLKSIILPSILTLLLASFYLLPLLFERGFVEADRIATSTVYSDHFVSPSQLWNSTWGFGGSGPGVEDGMSFKVGKVELVLALAVIIFFARKRNNYIRFYTLGALAAAFMSTSYSNFIWKSIPLLQVVQFPWRYLSILGFFVSILAGYSLALTNSKLLKSLFFILIITSLLIFNLKLFKPQTFFPADINLFTSSTYLSTVPSIIPEYRPIWLDKQNSISPITYTLPYIYYPTWKVTVDDKKVSTYPSVGGMLAFDNPSKSVNVRAFQSHTNLEIFAGALSLITLIYLAKIYVKN